MESLLWRHPWFCKLTNPSTPLSSVSSPLVLPYAMQMLCAIMFQVICVIAEPTGS
ncbi:hypothetical protein BDV29DRAFT_175927 [Aspergillus leporis]|uniref:Uncharacterized protein n=1 Tax=Aspergillus leporis TaxID=41062 RepID=A0A5N5WXS9_9EURO|nr:hypothetical protein BDV29DRAFT_175927 [Aspergillus leporis]